MSVTSVAAPPTRLVTKPFVAVTAAVFVFFLYVGVLVPILPTYVEDELRGGELGVGLAITAFAGAAIAARPLIGRLIERHGRRAVMIAGALLAAASGALYGFVDALPLLLVLRALTGVGEAALFVAAATLIADLSPTDRQAEASSYFSVAVYGGVGLGPLLGDALVQGGDFRVAFMVAGGCAALAALVAMTAPDTAALARHAASRNSGVLPAPVVGPPIGVDGPGRTPFIHPAALGPGAVLAFSTAAFAAFTAFVPDHAKALGMSGSGVIFAGYSVVCLVVRLAGAKLPERLGPRRSITIAFAATGVGLALLAAVPHVGALWVAAIAIGVGAAFTYPSLMALTISRVDDAERPRAIASFTMFFEIGTAGGGLVLGALADSFGKRFGFAAAVVLCVAGAWFARNVVVPPAPTTGKLAGGPEPDRFAPPRPVPVFAPAAGD